MQCGSTSRRSSRTVSLKLLEACDEWTLAAVVLGEMRLRSLGGGSYPALVEQSRRCVGRYPGWRLAGRLSTKKDPGNLLLRRHVAVGEFLGFGRHGRRQELAKFSGRRAGTALALPGDCRSGRSGECVRHRPRRSSRFLG